MEATSASNITTPRGAPLPLDAGSIFVLAVTLIVFCVPLLFLFPPFPPRQSDALEETHTKLGIDQAKSNLKNYTKKLEDVSSKPRESVGKIESLFVYPIKSCKGIELARTKVIPTGLEFDRLFTFAQLKSPFPVSVDGSDNEKAKQHTWEFITQRQFPLLATVEIELWQPDLAKMKGFRDLSAGSSDEVFLIVRFPWRQGGWRGLWEVFEAKCLRGWRGVPTTEVLLPVAFPDKSEITRKGYEFEPVRVWGEETVALNMGNELPEELRRYLGVSNKLALFRVDPEALRGVGKNAPAEEDAGYRPVVGFADSVSAVASDLDEAAGPGLTEEGKYPVHIMNLASVRDLDSKVTKDKDLEELSPRRFRANIFVSGLPAYDEDDWKKIKLRSEGSKQSDEAAFHVSCRTTRCKLPNVDPDTGVRHRVEPDKTLRVQRAIDAGAPKTGCLGMQMTPLFENKGSQHFYLEVGMTAEVLERGEHMYKR
ncbi:hypothetical protein N0V82_003039 [Gnomoniopsis sp. IMI 355080]|nr:hypothetical protein N0V82_003039 [Gnomoniopsis sp. IMI 355080]